MRVRAARISPGGIGRRDTTSGAAGSGACGGSSPEPRDTQYSASPAHCCHAPAFGFGDSQSIAIGIQNNAVVGIGRKGPRNQRRTPSVLNTAFYPSLMWNGRFAAGSGDPFDNSLGFAFPLPEGTTRFPPGDPLLTHLLMAQAHIPPTELVEAAGQ